MFEMTKDTIDQLRDGKIFTVKFIKRTDGSERTMRARLGVKSHLHGGQLPYDPIEKKLLPVFDMEKEAYRSVPLDAIIELKHHGVVEGV